MKRFVVVTITFLLLSYAAAAEENTDSQITAVTVYADRALVTRTVTLAVQEGSRAVTFGPLPVQIIEDSITASAQGTASIQIPGSKCTAAF